MKKIADRHLPFPRILHPWPEKRFLVTSALAAPAGICAGGGENGIYRDRPLCGIEVPFRILMADRRFRGEATLSGPCRCARP